MMSISHWGMFGPEPDFEYVEYVSWLNDGLPFIDCIMGGKTVRQIARETMARWAAERASA